MGLCLSQTLLFSLLVGKECEWGGSRGGHLLPASLLQGRGRLAPSLYLNFKSAKEAFITGETHPNAT